MAMAKGRLGLLVILVLLLGLGACTWARWPKREVRAWTPPTHPKMIGAFAPNARLQKATMLGGAKMIEPEDVAVAADGWIYGACKDGKIRRVDAANKQVEVVADTKGRPLGIVFDQQGRLWIADALAGLLRVDPPFGGGKLQKVHTIVTAFQGKRMRFVDDLDIDRKGRVYFSDVSVHYTFNFDTRSEIMARVPSGRLFRYDPTSGKTSLLLDKLHFANGVALSSKQDFVLITETSDYSVRRLWLTGPKAGRNDVFTANLPGYPDNINRSSRGGYWVALTSKRLDRVDLKLHPNLWLKKFVMMLPKALLPKPIRASFVVHLDAKGKPTHNLQDPDGSVIPNATSATEHKGHLYLGHIYHEWPGIGRYKLETTTKAAP